jgi:uncharacterized protein YdhG (YjbR/CyaY superfamily)
MKKPTTIDEYISEFPEEVQLILHKIRSTIKKAAPSAEEKISYGIPAFFMNKTHLIYFAGFKNHVGVYPAPKSTREFEKKLSEYKSGKATVKFPLNKPVPWKLLTEIVKLKIIENKARTVLKKKKFKSK